MHHGIARCVATLIALPLAPLAAQTQLRERQLDPAVTWDTEFHDMDDDGDLDLVRILGSGVAIEWNDGIGNLTRADWPLTAFPSSASGAVGDIDGDGDVDVIFASPDLTQAWWLRNDGSQNLSPTAMSLPFSPGVAAIDLADMDGDGDPDLVAAAQFGRTGVMLNDGAGTFAAPLLARHSFSRPGKLHVADLDGDGDLDVVCVDALVSSMLLLHNDGLGSLTPTVVSIGPPGSGAAGCVGDFNSDGFVDVLTSHGSAGNALWKGPSLSTGTPIQPGGTLFALTAVDLDLDGDLDVVGSPNNFFGSALEFWLNDGLGGDFVDVTAMRVSASDSGGQSIATGDLDGDGDADVVVGRRVLVFPAVDKLWINHHIQLDTPRSASLGSTVRFDLAWQPGYNSGLSIALPIAGIEAPFPMPTPFGRAYLSPAGAVSLPVVSLPPMGGVGQLNLPIPAQPNLSGLEFGIQALLYDVFGGNAPRLTGLQRLRIQ